MNRFFDIIYYKPLFQLIDRGIDYIYTLWEKLLSTQNGKNILTLLVPLFLCYCLFYSFSEKTRIPVYTNVLIYLLMFSFLMILKREQKWRNIVEQDNETLQKDVEIQEYLLLRNHYAGHNIKNAVQNIEWAIDGLETKLSDNDTEALQITLNNLRGTIDELKGLDDINEKTAVSIQEFWTVFEKLYRNPFKQKRIKFSVVYEENKVKDAIISKGFYLLFQIFNNLIQNAIRAVETTETKNITIEIAYANQNETAISFLILDTGVGISVENENIIFKNGFSTHQSSGAGLFYVKNELLHIKGDIQLVAATAPYKTAFKVTIPI
jgi:signal transduction histidine kinase